MFLPNFKVSFKRFREVQKTTLKSINLVNQAFGGVLKSKLIGKGPNWIALLTNGAGNILFRKTNKDVKYSKSKLSIFKV